MNGFMVYIEDIAALSGLSDEQMGKVTRALAAYAADQSAPDTGDVACDAVAALLLRKVDRDRDAYESRVDRNKANGSKGGRPKKPTETQENPENPLGFSETHKTQNVTVNETVTGNVTVTEERDTLLRPSDVVVVSLSAHAHEAEQTVSSDRETAPVHGSGPDAVQQYIKPGLTASQWVELRDLMTDLGDHADELVVYAVDEACGNGHPVWAYLRRILDALVREGVKTLEQARARGKPKPSAPAAAAPPKRPLAQQYGQRQYTEADQPDMTAEILAHKARKAAGGGTDVAAV